MTWVLAETDKHSGKAYAYIKCSDRMCEGDRVARGGPFGSAWVSQERLE